MIEAGFPHDQRVVDAVRRSCTPLRAAGVDTVVLGCTHYPLVRPILQRMLGRDVELITSGAPLARQVQHVLGARGLAHPRGDGAAPGHAAGGPTAGGHAAVGSPATEIVEGDYRFLCTGDAATFRSLGSRFLQLPLGPVEPVQLGEPAGALTGVRA
jgi:glutamate racemase